ncbi:hypothetical protein IAE22_31255, partial [Bacillus sp. S34]|nr:hypothetical protein [Bacillus sp. S34]
ELRDYAASGATVLVVCADSEQTGYDAQREPLTDEQWSTLFTNLDRITAAAAAVGVTATLHPHVGTVVETKDDVDGQAQNILLVGDDHLDVGVRVAGAAVLVGVGRGSERLCVLLERHDPSMHGGLHRWTVTTMEILGNGLPQRCHGREGHS